MNIENQDDVVSANGFSKYSSLTNHYENRFMEKILYAGLTADNVEWVAHEKIHGTNFSLITTDGVFVTPAKRTDIVHPTEGFYGCEIAVARYGDAIREIHAVHKQLFGTKVVQVFGEFAGEGIQSGVDYGKKDFYVFDIKLDGVYESDENVSHLCAAYGLKRPPLLAKGTYAEVMALDNTFESLVKLASTSDAGVMALWGHEMTLIGEGKNIAEGYVAKPVNPAYIGHDRVAIKCKTPKFSEKKNKVVREIKALSEKDSDQLAELVTYLNEARVHNVLSKLDKSTLTAKDFGRIGGLTIQDALEEIQRNEGDFVTLFEDPARAKKEFVQANNLIVRGMWNDILSGNI